MSNIDKQALRDAASTAISAITRLNYATDSGSADADAVREYHALAHPEALLALLDGLEAAESGIAELNDVLCKLLPGCQYMDPSDGGNVSPLEQVSRMVHDYRERMEAAGITTKGE